MIGGKDDAGLTCCAGSVVEQRNLVTLGGAEVLSLTAVNMTNMGPSCGDLLHELLTQLVGKEDARSNHHDSLSTRLQGTDGILNHDKGLATTSRNDHLTEVSSSHGIECTLLVGTESDSQVCVVSFPVLYTKRPHNTSVGSVW